MSYQEITGALMANSHPGSYCGQDAYNDMLITENTQCTSIMGGGNGQVAQLSLREIMGALNCMHDQQTVIGEPTMKDTQQYIVRRLTPTECARLQGMPDWWCNGVTHKDTAEYKMWGNGMALPCVVYVMQGVAEVLNRLQKE